VLEVRGVHIDNFHIVDLSVTGSYHMNVNEERQKNNNKTVLTGCLIEYKNIIRKLYLAGNKF